MGQPASALVAMHQRREFSRALRILADLVDEDEHVDDIEVGMDACNSEQVRMRISARVDFKAFDRRLAPQLGPQLGARAPDPVRRRTAVPWLERAAALKQVGDFFEAYAQASPDELAQVRVLAALAAQFPADVLVEIVIDDSTPGRRDFVIRIGAADGLLRSTVATGKATAGAEGDTG